QVRQRAVVARGRRGRFRGARALDRLGRAVLGGLAGELGVKLLVIRHGLAGEASEFARTGMDDDQRPLTDEGKKKMRAGARGLHEIVQQIDWLVSSPLVRAQQTAEIIGREFERAIDET